MPVKKAATIRKKFFSGKRFQLSGSLKKQAKNKFFKKYSSMYCIVLYFIYIFAMHNSYKNSSMDYEHKSYKL